MAITKDKKKTLVADLTDLLSSSSFLEPKLLEVTIASPLPIPKANPTSKS